jgi:hypothetical protein
VAKDEQMKERQKENQDAHHGARELPSLSLLENQCGCQIVRHLGKSLKRLLLISTMCRQMMA